MPNIKAEDWEDTEVATVRKGPADTAGEIREIPIEDLIPPAHDVRSWVPEEHIESLAASLAAVGLIHEPVVTPVGDRFEIISGHCRYLAAKRLGWKTIRCKIVAESDISSDIMKLHENMFRTDISPIEKAQFMRDLKDRYALTDEELAVRMGKSRAWVTRILACLEYPEDIRNALRDGVIPFEVAYELSKITDDTHRARLLEYAVRDGASRKIAKLWREDWEREARAMAAIHAEEAEQALRERQPQLLDRARLQQLEYREEFKAAHRVPTAPCDLCGNSVREDALVNLRICQDCIPAIQAVHDELSPAQKEA